MKLYKALVVQGREEPGARQLVALCAHLLAHKDSMVSWGIFTTELVLNDFMAQQLNG